MKQVLFCVIMQTMPEHDVSCCSSQDRMCEGGKSDEQRLVVVLQMRQPAAIVVFCGRGGGHSFYCFVGGGARATKDIITASQRSRSGKLSRIGWEGKIPSRAGAPAPQRHHHGEPAFPKREIEPDRLGG